VEVLESLAVSGNTMFSAGNIAHPVFSHVFGEDPELYAIEIRNLWEMGVKQKKRFWTDFRNIVEKNSLCWE
jgi:hypothetical protein